MNFATVSFRPLRSDCSAWRSVPAELTASFAAPATASLPRATESAMEAPDAFEVPRFSLNWLAPPAKPPPAPVCVSARKTLCSMLFVPSVGIQGYLMWCVTSVVPEQSQQDNNRNWNPQQPKKSASTESHVDLHPLLSGNTFCVSRMIRRVVEPFRTDNANPQTGVPLLVSNPVYVRAR